MQIHLIPCHQINTSQWDNCVQQSDNGLIYGQSFFLNHISPGWSGLVGENYDWVLPVVSRKKFGFSYLYQPPFTQQLGVYAKKGVVVPYQEIIQWLKANFSFWEISWNVATAKHIADAKILQTEATNFVLVLSKGYKTIAENFHTDLIKNLKKSTQSRLLYQPSPRFENCIYLFLLHYASRTPHVTQADYRNFRKLCFFAKENNQLICRDAINEKGDVLATALLLSGGNRMYNMMNTTTEEGRKKAANHFLINEIIKEFAGQNIIFDFEGSDLPGVKVFYENFGAVNEPYYHIRYNNLPWPVKLFKS